MSIIGIILLSIGNSRYIKYFLFTLIGRGITERVKNKKKTIYAQYVGKIMGQEENESEDYIEVWVFCRNCGFRTSSRYYYDQYCEENNEKKKSLIIKIKK